jgi:tRNA-2-methylthio-N6-dimethylallyladenosine synthase
LLNEIDGLERIRYTTSHPKDFTEDLIEAHSTCDKLMPLLHLPVQSGSTKILEKMNRDHTIEEYVNLIEKLKQKKPSIKLSSDFIIAYPGETNQDFEKSISLIKKIKFINIYSYIFSSRPGTPAANLKKIDLKIAKNRLLEFQGVVNDLKKKFRKNLINKEVKVLFENRTKDGLKFFGRDEYFNSVFVNSDEDLTGKTKTVKINLYNQNTLYGTVLDDKEVEFAA